MRLIRAAKLAPWAVLFALAACTSSGHHGASDATLTITGAPAAICGTGFGLGRDLPSYDPDGPNAFGAVSGSKGAEPDLCPNGTQPVRVLWDRLAADDPRPWPSDYFTVPANTGTGRQVNLVAGENYGADHILNVAGDFVVEEMNTLDGFSTVASQFVSLTGQLDLAAMGGVPLETSTPEKRVRYVFEGPSAPLFLVNLDPADPPRRGEREGVIAAMLPDGHLVLEPLHGLRAATRYALVLTRDAIGEGGRCVQPSPAYHRLHAGGVDLSAEETTLRERTLGALCDAASVDAGAALSNVALVEPFTTQSELDGLLEVRDQLLATPEPAFTPGSMSVETFDDGPVAAIVRAKFPAPDWRGADRRWTQDPVTGEFVQKGTLNLDVWLHIPSDRTGYTQPYPTAIYLHGLGGDVTDSPSVGRLLAEAGVATIAMSAVGHRNGDPDLNQYDFFNLIEVVLRFDRAFRGIRDNLRQSTIDQLQLLRLAERLRSTGFDAVGPFGVPDLKPGIPMIAYGISMGGVMGTNLVAAAPEVGLGVLNVAGGYLLKIILDSDFFGSLIPFVLDVLAPGREVSEDELALLISVMQTVVDAGDPSNSARHLYAEPLLGAEPRSVLFTQSIPDTVLPNSANEVLFRTLGAPRLAQGVHAISGLADGATPNAGNVSSTITSGLFQYDDYHKEGGGDLVPSTHGGVAFSHEARVQSRAFIRSWLDGLSPLGVPTAAPVILDPFDAGQVAEFGDPAR
ncbi:MAG: hypothetical protein KC466_05175 [Myxococcales bacterium]|nr:hypothetical protein [Myxococcales bacterium]